MARAAPIVAALVVLLSLASLALCAEAGSITIAGTGSTLQESVITEWLFSFQLLRPVVAPDYVATGSSAAVARLQAGDESIDWASTDAPSDAATLDKFPKIIQYPILAAPIAFLINIPGLSSLMLNLTRQAVVGIFSGVINRWDDPEIIAYNPALTPTQRNNTILVVVRRDGSGTSNILLEALNQFNSTVFPDAPTNQFPTDISSLPNFITKIGSTGVAGEVLSTQYSIGYTALSFAQVDNIAVALVQNKRGQFVSPFPSSAIDAAIAATPLENRTNIANLIDLDEDLYYPLTSYTYIQTLNLGSGAEVAGDSCDERIQTFRMFRWALTDPFAINAARLRAYFPLPPAIAAEVIGDFERELACRGDLLLRLTRSPQHSSKLFEVILAFTMFAWFLSLIAIAYSWWSSSRAKNPLFYAVCLLLGCSLAYLSSVFFYLLPEHTWTCELRKWLLTNGLTLLLGVMFARGWQLHALKSGPRVIQTSKLLLIVSIITGGQLIILVIWTAVDPWESQQILINQIDRITAFRCHCDHMIIWLLLELGFFLILLSWGIYVVYATWRNRAAVDSRWTLIAVYNTLIAIFIVLPLIVVAVDSDDWVFYVSVPTMLLSVVSCVLSIYGAAILRRIWDYVQKSSGSGSQEEPGKVSSLRMTVGGGV